jgi:membrane fusion protein, multidrug efflux system
MKNLLNKLNSFRKKLGKWFWVILIILVIGVGGYFLFGRKSGSGTTSVAVQKGEVKEELVLTGSVMADKYAALSFPTGGKIAGVYVKEGEWVKKGRALTALDKVVLNAAYQQALNNYRNYQAAAENTLDSVKGHSADETFTQKATRTAAEVARDNAYDAVTAAEYNLRNSTLYAPFDGLITSLPFGSPGVNVNVTDMQVEILDPASIYFEVDADQSEVISIKEKQKVVIILDSYRDKEFSGEASFVGYTPKPNEVGTVYRVKVTLTNSDIKEILPRIGMTGDAKFILSQKENVLYAPVSFVHSDKDGRYVNLGKVGNKVRVTTGIENENVVEIVSGVKEGDVLYD